MSLFATVRAGYDPAAVEAELARYRDQVRQLEDQLAAARRPADTVEGDAALIAKTLLTAQAAADRVRQDAEDEARRLLETARGEAQSLRDRAQHDAAAWNAQAATAASQYRALVDALTQTGRDHLDQITAAVALVAESLQALGAARPSEGFAAAAIPDPALAVSATPDGRVADRAPDTPSTVPDTPADPVEPAASVAPADPVVSDTPTLAPQLDWAPDDPGTDGEPAPGVVPPATPDAPVAPAGPAAPVLVEDGDADAAGEEAPIINIAWRPTLPSPFSLEEAGGATQ